MELTKSTARKLFTESPDWFKKELEKEFGKETFLKINFKDIKTFSDACEARGTTEKDFNSKWSDPALPNDTLFYEKLKLVVKAINQDWTPNWNNTNQYKWWPYFNLSSRFSFSNTNYNYDNTNTNVSSHLCGHCSINPAHMAKKDLIANSVGTSWENDIKKAKA